MCNPTVAPTDPIIRRAVASDGAACAGIVHSWLASTPWIETPPSLTELTEALTKGISAQQVWVAGDPVQGYLSFGPDEALIRGFYVARPGSGVGKALLDHIKQGKRYLQLWTHAPNTRAHAFYSREGFALTGAERDGADGPVELQMEWRAA